MLENLKKQISRRKKRIGRGLGSGKGKTGGRGQKGQKARGKVALGFSGGGLPLYKKLPLLRGWGNKPVSRRPVVVALDDLSVFKSGEEVNLETLLAKGVVAKGKVKERGVKILDGKIEVALKVSGVEVSKSAREKIEKAGGHVLP